MQHKLCKFQTKAYVKIMQIITWLGFYQEIQFGFFIY